MDVKKYWPYAVLLAGAILSILIAFISIKTFSGTNDTASSTPSTATTTAIVVPEEKPGFFKKLFGLFSSRAPIPQIGGTGETPNEPSPEEIIPEENPSEELPEPVHNEWYPGYTFAPTELPPEIPPQQQTPIVPDTVVLNADVVTGSGNADDEYFTITAPAENRAPIVITGMKVQSVVTKNNGVIGQGVHTFLQSQDNLRQLISLAPGATAYVFTGKSPLSYSFRINKCMGFLDQFHTFIPGIATDCPLIEEKDLPVYPNHLNDDCLDYISNQAQCYDHRDPFPENIKPECQHVILERNNYYYCVSHHRTDKDFLLTDWRIYLDRGQELWKTRREHIQLLNQKGAVISEFSY